jgi:hypothetical protein
LHAQIAFQFAQLSAESWLRNGDRLSCRRQATGIRNGDKVLQGT